MNGSGVNDVVPKDFNPVALRLREAEKSNLQSDWIIERVLQFSR